MLLQGYIVRRTIIRPKIIGNRFTEEKNPFFSDEKNLEF